MACSLFAVQPGAYSEEVKEEQAAPSGVQYLKSEDFRDFVSSGVVVIDFYADWCGPCKKLKPIFNELSHQYSGKAKFGKVNIDHARTIGNKYNVKTLPTVILFKDGKEIKRRGPGSKQDFVYWMRDAL